MGEALTSKTWVPTYYLAIITTKNCMKMIDIGPMGAWVPAYLRQKSGLNDLGEFLNSWYNALLNKK